MPEYQYDWGLIRLRWEAGESAYSIAHDEDTPISQTISKRARKEGWIRDISEARIGSETLPESITDKLRPIEAQVLVYISEGETQKNAANLAGISHETISRWKKERPQYAQAHQVAVGIKNRNRRTKVESSTDTRDQRWLLERDPDSREDYGQAQATFVGRNTVNVLGHVDLGISRKYHGTLENSE